jgi:hypothetical protein
MLATGLLPAQRALTEVVAPVLPAPLRAAVAAEGTPRLGVLTWLHLQNLDLQSIKSSSLSDVQACEDSLLFLHVAYTVPSRQPAV